ncbi:hypothetical protein K7432_013569 [Basidiobolus ranarum]|uniref:F-box domain-containing protein n=1 Tax=Basidiobolus ranarum TaxID=34480 RepID=A0ABR2WJ04_9FUNG
MASVPDTFDSLAPSLLHSFPCELWCTVLQYLPASSWYTLGKVDLRLKGLINEGFRRLSFEQQKRLCLDLLAQRDHTAFLPETKDEDLDLPNLPPPKSLSWFPLRLGIQELVKVEPNNNNALSELFWIMGDKQFYLDDLMQRFVKKYKHLFPKDVVLLTDTFFPSPITKTTGEYNRNNYYLGPKLQDFGFFQYRNEHIHLPLSYTQFLIHFASFFHALLQTQNFTFHGIRELGYCREEFLHEFRTLELVHVKVITEDDFRYENRKGRFLLFCSIGTEYFVYIDVTESTQETFGALYGQKSNDTQVGDTVFRIADGIPEWIEMITNSQSPHYIDAILRSLDY